MVFDFILIFLVKMMNETKIMKPPDTVEHSLWKTSCLPKLKFPELDPSEKITTHFFLFCKYELHKMESIQTKKKWNHL